MMSPERPDGSLSAAARGGSYFKPEKGASKCDVSASLADISTPIGEGVSDAADDHHVGVPVSDISTEGDVVDISIPNCDIKARDSSVIGAHTVDISSGGRDDVSIRMDDSTTAAGADVRSSSSSISSSGGGSGSSSSSAGLSFSSIPKNVLKRFQEFEQKKATPSLDNIEARLRDAATRRQQFREWLASKARTRARTLEAVELPGGELRQRLQERLSAAEKNRAQLHALERQRQCGATKRRQLARRGAQAQAAEKSAQIRMALQSRAAAARAVRAEARQHRRAVLAQRAAQRTARRALLAMLEEERAAQLQASLEERIATAGAKRLARIAAARQRAASTSSQARQVAHAVWVARQRDGEKRRELMDRRVQGARERRAQILRQRGGCIGSVHCHARKRLLQERLSKMLCRCWHQFRASRCTTHALAHAFGDCRVSVASLAALPFDEVAARITAPTTLRHVAALLACFERRLRLTASSPPQNIDTLLAKVTTAPKRMPPGKRASHPGTLTGPVDPTVRQPPVKTPQFQNPGAAPTIKSAAAAGGRGGAAGRGGFDGSVNKSPGGSPGGATSYGARFPARVFLCAFMIISHPDAVFSGSGPGERHLAQSAAALLPRFESLLQMLLQAPQAGPVAAQDAGNGSISTSPSSSPAVASGVTFISPAVTATATASGASNSPGVTVLEPPVPDGSQLALQASLPGINAGSGLPAVTNKFSDATSEDPFLPTTRGPAGIVGRSSWELSCQLAAVARPTPVPDCARRQPSFARQLALFDEAWVKYLESFVAWKVRDVAQLEGDLISMACQLEESMLVRLGGVRGGQLSHDLQAICDQVVQDQQLLRDRVCRLGGSAAVSRMEAALHDLRARFVMVPESSDPLPCASDSSNLSDRAAQPTEIPPAPTEPASAAALEQQPLRDSTCATDLSPSSSELSPPAVFSPAKAQEKNLKPESQPCPAKSVTPGRGTAAQGGGGSPFSFSYPAIKKSRNSSAMAEAAPLLVKSPPKSIEPSAEPSQGSTRAASAKVVPLPQGAALEAARKLPGPATKGEMISQGLQTGEKMIAIPHPGAVSMAPGILSNEQMVLELLHDASWRPNTGADAEADANVVPMTAEGALLQLQARIRKAMKLAFWDRLSESLLEDPPQLAPLSSLVGEIRDELAAIAPASWHQEIHANLDTDLLTQILGSGSLDFAYMCQLMDFCCQIIMRMGAPARDAAAQEAHRKVLAELAVELAAAVPPASQTMARKTFARAVVKGLKHVFDQLQVLKSDVSEYRLAALAPHIQGDTGLEYLQAAFARRFDLPVKPGGSLSAQHIKGKLPRTNAWLCEGAAALRSARDEIEAASLATAGANQIATPGNPAHSVLNDSAQVQAGGVGSAGSNVPLHIRAGSRVPLRGLPAKDPVPATPAAPTARLSTPRAVDWASHATIVRLGLCQLAQLPEEIDSNVAPETLHLDGVRILALQNSFQKMLVLASGMLTIRQSLVMHGLAGAEVDAVLMASKVQLCELLDRPDVKIAAISERAADIVQSAVPLYKQQPAATAASANVDPAGATLALRGVLGQVLSQMLTPGSTMFELVARSLAGALRAAVLVGPLSNQGAALAKFFLRKAGAANLSEELLSLAEALDKLAAVSLKVHEGWYQILCKPAPLP